MSLKEQMLNAISKVDKKYHVGDKVNIRNSSEDGLKYKVSKVNSISYDLEVDLTDEEIENCKKIVSDSFYFYSPSFECWEEKRKKDVPYSEDQIMNAKMIIDHRYIYNVKEEDLLPK